MKILEYLITLVSVVGAILMSFDSGYGFFFFLLANILSIYFFNRKGMGGFTLVNYVFLATSLNGIYTFFIK
jgi:nicotinamide riboside transporter PnuC